MEVLTQKDRKYLKSLAMTMEAKYQVGKMGVAKTQLDLLDKALEAHELIKVKVLLNVFDDLATIANQISSELGATVVHIIGRVIILYRKSSVPGFEHLI